MAARKPVPTVLQLEAAECGAASLAMVLGRYGRHAPLDELRTLCGVSRDGSKASSLLRAARAFGMEAKGLKAEPHHLPGLTYPLIAFVNFNHFLVLEGATADRVWINDPANGRRVETMEAFEQGFTGVVLTFAPGPEFRRGDTRPGILRSLAGRFAGVTPALWFVGLASLALVIPGILVPVFSLIFVDYVLVRALDDWLVPLMIGMGLTALVRFVLLELQSQTLLRAGTEMTLRTADTLVARLLCLPISFFDQRFAGEIADRVGLNEDLAQLLTGELAAAAVNVLMALFFLAAMLLWYPPLALAVAALALVNVLVLVLSARAMSEKYRRLSIDQGKLMGARVAGLRDMETFKASGAEDMLFARWLGLQANVINGGQGLARLSALITPLPGLISAAIAAMVLIWGGFAIMDGEMTIGGLVAFQSLAASFAGPVAALAGFGAEVQQIRSHTQRLDDILVQQVDPRFSDAANTDLPEPDDPLPRGAVELRAVSFGYAPLDPPLIEDLSLTLSPGSRIALVGASGSGKSTLGKLIGGLEQPRMGEVLIDGVAPLDWPREALAARLAYIRQEVMLFAGSVRENICLWDRTIAEADMIRAAHDAQIHDAISARPGGYDAPIAEGGGNFSGGERQRIEIARALATNPSVIILDEATSALDPVTELGVMEAIRRRGATCIVIAHRLSAIRDCDEIIVLDRGRVAERGRHQDLMASAGVYAALLEA